MNNLEENKSCVNTVIEGEPVKLKKHINNYLSAILYYENPAVEYIESKYIRYCPEGGMLFFVNKLNLN